RTLETRGEEDCSGEGERSGARQAELGHGRRPWQRCRGGCKRGTPSPAIRVPRARPERVDEPDPGDVLPRMAGQLDQPIFAGRARREEPRPRPAIDARPAPFAGTCATLSNASPALPG